MLLQDSMVNPGTQCGSTGLTCHMSTFCIYNYYYSSLTLSAWFLDSELSICLHPGCFRIAYRYFLSVMSVTLSDNCILDV